MQEESPIEITVIDHVVLRTTHLRRMIAFYRDVLGCPVEREPGASGLAQLRAGHSLIDILDVSGSSDRDEDAGPDSANMDHVCFQLKHWDAKRIADYLRRHSVTTGDVVMRYGAKGTGPSIYISDPDGNTVELKGDPADFSQGRPPQSSSP